MHNVKVNKIKNVSSKQKMYSSMHFYFHVFFFKMRDIFFPRMDILKEADIKPGFCVLDYGCGSGSYTILLAKIVQDFGKVYALDAHPLAISRINNLISMKKIKNVNVIHSFCATGLPDNSVDTVLLYDTFHALDNPAEVLEELHRVLKTNGILSFYDHRMTNSKIIHDITQNRLFTLDKKNKKTYIFLKR